MKFSSNVVLYWDKEALLLWFYLIYRLLLISMILSMGLWLFVAGFPDYSQSWGNLHNGVPCKVGPLLSVEVPLLDHLQIENSVWNQITEISGTTKVWMQPPNTAEAFTFWSSLPMLLRAVPSNPISCKINYRELGWTYLSADFGSADFALWGSSAVSVQLRASWGVCILLPSPLESSSWAESGSTEVRRIHVEPDLLV